MAPAIDTPPIPRTELDSFSQHLKASNRILALCGAGLSAASGLPTFRGAGGYWRSFDATSLATPEAFHLNPGLVWQFYNYRRHMALKSSPNPAHFALAELARKKPDFLTISQNVDGLSPRAKHPQESLELLHGSLYDIKCDAFDCTYSERNNFTDPVVPALAIPKDPNSPNGEADISQAEVHMRDIPASELPRCPQCKSGLLRPGVVWFGEPLPSRTLERVDRWLYSPENIDLLLVIGTSAVVYPAAGYIAKARSKGARVAVINTERPDQVASKLEKGDWFFQGDAGIVMPQILEAVTGPLGEAEQKL